jgi:hypothetical protein
VRKGDWRTLAQGDCVLLLERVSLLLECVLLLEGDCRTLAQGSTAQPSASKVESQPLETGELTTREIRLGREGGIVEVGLSLPSILCLSLPLSLSLSLYFSPPPLSLSLARAISLARSLARSSLSLFQRARRESARSSNRAAVRASA